MIASLLTVNNVIDALAVGVLAGLRAVLVVIRIRKRRLEKLLQRLEREDRECRSSDALR